MQHPPQDKQAKYIEIFDKVAPTFGASGPQTFSYFGQRLVELAQVKTGQSVLDVACGRGAVLFPAAQQVGPSGQVTAVDLAPGMVRETGAQIKERGLKNVTLALMGANQLAFADATFDTLLAGFGIFFFPDAICELYRVLKPGGRIGVTIFKWDSAYMQILFETLRTHLDYDLPPFLELEELKNGYKEAGFSGISAQNECKKFLYQDKEEWWTAIWSLGTRGALESMIPETLAHFKAEVFAKLQIFSTAKGMMLPINIYYVFGDK